MIANFAGRDSPAPLMQSTILDFAYKARTRVLWIEACIEGAIKKDRYFGVLHI